MRKRPVLSGILALLAILVVAFLAGPRVDLDETLTPTNLPVDLATYLAEQEARFDDVTPGTEKTIIWAGSTGVQTPVSVIYLHGFSATRQEIAPLPDSLAARLGANLYYTRLTGHGRGGEAMMEGTVNAWLNDTWEAYEIGKRLGERVILISVSTGGTLATWLTAQPNTEQVAANLLISPNFMPAASNVQLLTLPWGAQIADALAPEEYSWEPLNEAHGRYWTTRYPTKALIPMMGLVTLVNDLALEENAVPTLVIYSTLDDVVSPAATENAYARLGGMKDIIVYNETENPSQHVLAGDILAPASNQPLLNFMLAFLENVL